MENLVGKLAFFTILNIFQYSSRAAKNYFPGRLRRFWATSILRNFKGNSMLRKILLWNCGYIFLNIFLIAVQNVQKQL